jgi:hypothetical protein
LIEQKKAGYEGVDDAIEAVISAAEKKGKISAKTATTLRASKKSTDDLTKQTKKLVPAAEAVADASGVDSTTREKTKALGHEQYRNE